MPTDNASVGTSASPASMRLEETDATPAAISGEVPVQRDRGTPQEAPQVGADRTSQADADEAVVAAPTAQAVEPKRPLSSAESQPAAADCPVSAAVDTEAALDHIDQDLAELESLLAQSISDASSIAESVMQAAPPEPEPKPATEESAPQGTAEGDAPPGDAGTGDPVNEDLLQTDTSADEPTAAASPDADASGQPVEAPIETAGGADSLAQPVAAAESATSGTAETPLRPRAESPLNAIQQLIETVVVRPLTIVDAPFSGLSASIKTAIGLAGIATLVVALATWVIGSIR